MTNEWISVKDRLPHNEQLVLYFFIYKTKATVIRIGKFWANDGRKKPCFSNHNSVSYINENQVTHWQPLPEPPK